jgi:hypothetical protein
VSEHPHSKGRRRGGKALDTSRRGGIELDAQADKAEGEWARIRERCRSTVGHVVDSVVIAEASTGRIVEHDSRAEGLSGRSRAQIRPRLRSDLCPAGDAARPRPATRVSRVGRVEAPVQYTEMVTRVADIKDGRRTGTVLRDITEEWLAATPKGAFEPRCGTRHSAPACGTTRSSSRKWSSAEPANPREPSEAV